MLPIDKATNDFPRDIDGKLESEDYYIPCAKGAMIYHYGRNILEAYVPFGSITKANNILKACTDNNIEITNCLIGDNEMTFHFKSKDMSFISSLLKAKVLGKNIRPSSSKNLPKSNYVIPKEDLSLYKIISNEVPQDKVLLISKITDDFLVQKLANKYKDIDIKSDIKKKCMSRQKKEYIHSMGMWDEYLKFLQIEIIHRLKEQNG